VAGGALSAAARGAGRAASFRDVFAVREYRFLFAASVFSGGGDCVAKAAITALVFQRTGSAALSATAFGISYLPWLAGGPLLAAVAERYRYRSVMVTCDLVRGLVMVLLAIPSLPVVVMLLLLFAAESASPPFHAARSALLPRLLTGDRYVVGIALQASTGQAAQLAGYALGAALATVRPSAALLANALTFVLSATVIRFGVGEHGPTEAQRAERRHLGRETLDGFRVVFTDPALRAIALLVFSVMLFASVPEGLAAAWATELSESRVDQGWIQGAIMVATPFGFMLGGVLIGRLARPATRQRLIMPFAVLAPLALVPSFANPPVPLLALQCTICGFAVAGMMPAANGLFVQALPPSYRARAFGVMQSGVQVTQGIGVLATGLLADRYAIGSVVGGWSLVGVLLLLAMRSRRGRRGAS
jgi:MFS family permease